MLIEKKNEESKENNILINIFKFKQFKFGILILLLLLFLGSQNTMVFNNQVFAQPDNTGSRESFSSSQAESIFSSNQILRENDRGENVKKSSKDS